MTKGTVEGGASASPNTVKLHIDFETRSACDLKKKGMHAYSKDPTTDVWCMSYAIDEEPVDHWVRGEEFPQRLRELFEDVSTIVHIYGHNVGFEYEIWTNIMTPRYGWPAISVEQCFCTAAMARAMALPGDLDGAAKGLGLEIEKDAAGKRLMLQMCRPRKITDEGEIIWWESEEKLKRLIAYCDNDVLVERELDRRLLQLDKKERAIWLLDHKINNRGIMIDVDSVVAAENVVKKVTEDLNKRLYALTNGQVMTCSQIARLADWIEDQGYCVDALDKATVTEMLEDKNVPQNVKLALQLRQEAAKTSTAKLTAMLNSVCPDNRARGLLLYHGASTGRWAGRRIQVQNLPRQTLTQAQLDTALELIRKGDIPLIELTFGSVMHLVSECLRSMICAPDGYRLITADFSAIEARVVAWLAGQQDIVEAFREGEDVYKHAASSIYKKKREDITKEERFIGKVATLALGYQGGSSAFSKMASAYGVDISDEEAEEIKTAWRNANRKITSLWYNLEEAAIDAVRNPGAKVPVRKGKIIFRTSGSFLFCRLPSGRVLTYPYPKVETVYTSYGAKDALFYWGQDTYTRKWGKLQTYGGKLCENVTQAIARDLLAEAMLRVESAGYPVVMHVHDEIVSEVPEGFGSVTEFENLMSVTPEWAEGLPVAAEGWEGKRYRK